MLYLDPIIVCYFFKIEIVCFFPEYFINSFVCKYIFFQVHCSLEFNI